jgi:methionine sulfoxide reductase catalytic subunit
MTRNSLSTFKYPVPPTSQITPRSAFLNRRELILGAGIATVGITSSLSQKVNAASIIKPIVSTRNVNFKPSDPPTARSLATTYNNYYEFGTSKEEPATSAQKLTVNPWSIEVSGEVMKSRRIDLEELMRLPLEERIYRFRCVEAWSMVVPWIGF